MANVKVGLESLFAQSSLVSKVKHEPRVVHRPPSPPPPLIDEPQIPPSPPAIVDESPSIPDQLASIVDEIVEVTNKNTELTASINALQLQLNENYQKINNHKSNIKEIIRTAPEDQRIELSTFVRNMLAKKTHKPDDSNHSSKSKKPKVSSQPSPQIPNASQSALKRKLNENTRSVSEGSPVMSNTLSPKHISNNNENISNNNNNNNVILVDTSPEISGKKAKITVNRREAVGSIVLDSIRTLDTVSEFSVESYYRDSHHLKKLRSLQIGTDNFFVTSSRDGSIKFWQLKYAPHVVVEEWGSMDNKNLHMTSYVNALAWSNSGKRLALGFFVPENSQSKQLVVLNTEGIDKKNINTRYVEAKPHTKSINAISFAGDSENSIFTAGADKKIYLWTLGKLQAEHRLIHSEHTNELLCILPNMTRDSLLSGGQDKKVVSWSLVQEKPDGIFRFDAGVSNIKKNPIDVNTILVGLRARDNQLHVLDSRTYDTVLKLGCQWAGPMSPNQFTQCNWHPNGYVIASGGEPQIVTLWDIRYVQAEKPFQTLTLHQKEKTIYQSAFISPKTMVTYAADKRIGIHTLS